MGKLISQGVGLLVRLNFHEHHPLRKDAPRCSQLQWLPRALLHGKITKRKGIHQAKLMLFFIKRNQSRKQLRHDHTFLLQASMQENVSSLPRDPISRGKTVLPGFGETQQDSLAKNGNW